MKTCLRTGTYTSEHRCTRLKLPFIGRLWIKFESRRLRRSRWLVAGVEAGNVASRARSVHMIIYSAHQSGDYVATQLRASSPACSSRHWVETKVFGHELK